MAQSAVAISLLTTVDHQILYYAGALCLGSFAVGPKLQGTSVILCWKSVRELTNQEQAFINRPQTYRREYS